MLGTLVKIFPNCTYINLNNGYFNLNSPRTTKSRVDYINGAIDRYDYAELYLVNNKDCIPKLRAANNNREPGAVTKNNRRNKIDNRMTNSFRTLHTRTNLSHSNEPNQRPVNKITNYFKAITPNNHLIDALKLQSQDRFFHQQ